MSVVANVAINVDAANAIQQLNRVKTASQDVQGGLSQAAVGAKGLGAALTAALGPMLTISAALATVQKGLSVAFERGAAEQRLRNLTDSAGEFDAAMALASQSAAKFGITQTEASTALADVYGRLKGVGFGLQETGQIYQGFNAIALQSGLAGEEAAGAFFQLSQALGKGKLNGDEFVIVAERMPQLLDAIAQTTGRSRGELTQMAQDGQITSQVLYEALSGAAGASDNLNDKLTAQQQTFNNLRQVTDELLNVLGQVFAPVVVAGAEGLAKVGQMMADWYGYLGNVVFPKVQEALQPVITSLKAAFEDINFDAIRVAIQSILIGGFEIAVGVISNFSNVLSFVIDGFKALSQNPVFQFIAEQVGRLAGHLGLTNDQVGKFKEEQNKASDATAETVKNYSSLPPEIENAKEKAKELKEEQKEVTKAIQESIKAIDTSSKIATAASEQRSSIAAAYYEAELSINQVLIEQKNQQLENTKSISERFRLIEEIYKLTKQQAVLEYQATKANIDAEVERAQLAVATYEQKVKEVESIIYLAAAQGKVNEEHYKALNAIREAANIAQIQAGTVAEVATQQERAARAVLQGKLDTAETERSQRMISASTDRVDQSQRMVAASTDRAAGSSATFAKNMQSVASSAEAAAGSILRMTQGVTGNRGEPGAQFGEAGRNRAFMAEYAEAFNKLQQEMLNMGIKQAENASREMMDRFMQRAEEYNQAVAAEANRRAVEAWNKYVPGPVGPLSLRLQPSSMSLDSAMTQQNRSINPQVSISTGPVMQMDGQNYVTVNDLQQATSSAAKLGAELALSQLQTNPTVRRSIGVAR
jgi:tape measure domain-containing protein